MPHIRIAFVAPAALRPGFSRSPFLSGRDSPLQRLSARPRSPVPPSSAARVLPTASQQPPRGGSGPDDNDDDQSSAARAQTRISITRRQMIQLVNGALGLATLSLLVKMREQFRLISPQAVATALGLRPLPSRAALASTLSAGGATPVSAEALEFLRSIESHAPFRAPDFPRGADWINSRPLSLSADLSGKLVLLDFFTYCCINCQHVLPKLRALEDKYGADGRGGFVVVGVHSAKFAAERDTANIAAAVERHDIRHPVVNDDRMAMWNAVGVSSWPTLALLGPRGNLVSLWTGERQEADIDTIVAAALEFYADEIDHRPLPPAPRYSSTAGAAAARERIAQSPLRYPGKVALSADEASLFVSDTGNHRVLEIDPATGATRRAFGSGEPGLADSRDPAAARFDAPQGVAVRGGTLFVADTEAHAVRAVDLSSGAVATLGGDGEQGFDYRAGKRGSAQRLSSPWDVEVVGDYLYVAMAGTHQVWRVALPAVDGAGANGSVSTLVRDAGAWEVFSGTGRELELNSGNAREAAWAQPSHLSSGANGEIFVADSESSTVRVVETAASNGRNGTRTLAGGDGLLAENLFAFGDKDGRGSKAKFQHPLAVCYDRDGERVFVADSYNHRIKVVDSAGNARVFCGSGQPGLKDGKAKEAMFWEPAGLALSQDGKKLYVADTNNFSVRVVDTEQRSVRTIPVSTAGGTFSTVSSTSGQGKALIPYRGRAVLISSDETVKPGSTVKFSLNLPEKAHFTEGTTSRFQVNVKTGESGGNPQSVDLLSSGTITTGSGTGSFAVDTSKFVDKLGGVSAIEVETVTYYCTDADDVCRTEADIFSFALSESGAKGSEVSHTIKPRQPQSVGSIPKFVKSGQ